MNLADKPIGVLVLAALIVVLSISAVVVGIQFLSFLLTPMPFSDKLYTVMLSLVGIGTGGFGIYIAKGLWDLKPWARTTAMLLLGFAFIGSVGGALMGKPAPIVVVLLSMFFIVYLIRPEVKSRFSRT